MQFAPLQVSCHRDTPCMWHDSSICVDLHAIALRCYGTCLWLMQMRRHHGLQPARILLSGFAFIMMCHLPPQPMILSSASLSSPLTVHGTEGFVGLPFLVYSIVMLLRRGKFSAYVFPADVKKQGASCPFLLRPPPRNGNVISAHAASPPKRGLPHMQPERTDTKELKGTMPQGPPAARVASITMPEPDSWRTSMIVLIAWPLCKPASHPLVGKRLHSWMQKTSTMSRAGGEQKPLLHRSASQDPLLPKHDTPEACLFRVYWDVRTAQPGTSSQELQGHLATPAPTPQPKVRLFADDLPAVIMQAPPGPNRGGGSLDQIGLARETARLHIKRYVFVHFFSGYRRQHDLHAILEQAPLPDGSQLLTIYIDLCMQKRDGNLAADTETSWWIARMRAGQLIGAGGGPPCESFTASRFQDNGPRPLRTGQHPDGLPALNAREWQQLRIGSRLVFFIFWNLPS